MRADSRFYAHTVVAACREMDVRFSITIRQRASLRDLIEAIPEDDWTPIPYWMDAAADVAETTYTPFQTKPDAPPVRLIVRRVKPTPGSQLALFARYSYHAFITDRDGETLELEAEEAGGRRTAARQTNGNGGGASRTQRARAQAKAASGPDNAPALRKRLIEIATERGFDEDGVRSAVTDRTGKSIDDLDASELTPLVEAAAKKLQETRQAKAA